MTVEEAGTWREQTSGGFAFKVFPGGHFYLTDHIDQVAATLTEGLLATTPAGAPALP